MGRIPHEHGDLRGRSMYGWARVRSPLDQALLGHIAEAAHPDDLVRVFEMLLAS